MQDDKKSVEDALQELSDIGQEIEAAKARFESKVDSWWDKLSEQDREWAFYSVCKRIAQAELREKSTYRKVLYGHFGFGPNMYASGMDCGFMAIHNAIFDGEEKMAMESINRLEVIDGTGRICVRYLKDDEKVRYSLQDDNRTLKIFIDEKFKWKDTL